MLEKKLSRRSFFKMAAVTAGAVAATEAGSLLVEDPERAQAAEQDDVKIVRSTCRACGKMECGSLITVRNGRVVHIEGDNRAHASRGNLCAKGRAGVQALYHPDRIRHPLMRTAPKGEDPQWKRIGHDEAIQKIADGLNAVIDKYGQHAIKSLHGTSRLTTYGVETFVGNVLGSANAGSPAGILCKGPRYSSASMIAFPGAHWCSLTDGQKVNFQWGSNSEVSNYDSSCRTTVDEHVKADTTICIGPRLQNLGKEADIWINVRPGTDDALALGFLHQLVFNENCHPDMLFVKKWTNASFLYCEDIEPSGWTWSVPGEAEGKQECGYYPLNIRTRIVKESDLVEGGSPRKMAYWDTKSNSLQFFDTATQLWQGQAEYQYPDRDKATMTDAGLLPIDEGFPVDIDPALEGTFEIVLKDGRTVSAEPVWQMFERHLQPWTAEHTAEICDVNPDDIVAAMEAYGKETGQGGVIFQLALEHAGNSVQTTMLPLIISALMNNLDGPGGNRGGECLNAVNDTYFMYMIDWANPSFDPKEQQKIVGGDRFPLTPFFNAVGGPAMYHDPISASEAILYDDPYPIRGMLSASGAHWNSGNASMNWEAFKTLDFYAGWELWHTPTIELADIVMPAAHYLEVSTIRPSQGAECALGAQVQVVERQGEAGWDSFEIYSELARAMNRPVWPDSPEKKPFPFWPDEWVKPWPDTEKELLDMEVLPMRIPISCPGPTGEQMHANDWDDFVAQYQEHGQFDLRDVSNFGYLYRYQWGFLRPRLDTRNDPLVPGFNTPTGRFEILSTILESYHGKNTKWQEAPGSYNGIPGYREPVESPIASPELYKEYPIILTSGRRNPLYFHSEGRQQPWLRELTPCPSFQINPETAAKLGIEQGDWCWIESKRGKIRQTADLFYGIKPGTIECDHQWWYPELSAPKHGWDLSNVNILVNTDHESQDPIIGSGNMRAYLVKVYKATPENSPFGNPCPCDDDGTEIIHTPDDPRLLEWLPTYEYEKTAE